MSEGRPPVPPGAGTPGETSAGRERHVSASDGLRLFVRDFLPEASATPPGVPVVCLPGLTRDSRDFERLGAHVSRTVRPQRRVVAIDFRGRGRSERGDPDGYSIGRELDDVLDVMTALGIERAIMLGTSRGGLVTMQMAVLRPASIAGAVLNDVGPVIDGRGLLKIKNALEHAREPRDWEDAARLLAEAYRAQFPATDARGWAEMARRTYVDEGGRPVPAHDPALLDALRRIDFSHPLPKMWPQFDALAKAPLLTLRGANSDLLTAETMRQMQERCPAMHSHVVPDAGHAPSLGTEEELRVLARFFATVDATR